MTTEIPDDWFETTARANFERAFLPSSNQPNLRYLQIGAFTGNASVWLMENVLTSPTSELHDVDPFDDGHSPELDGIDFEEVYRIYQERTKPWRLLHDPSEGGKLTLHRTTSYRFFTWVGFYNVKPFDFIYIDGDHSVINTLEDAVMAYRCLKPGGMLCFDDYTWQSKHGVYYEPTMAIDMVKVMYAGRLQVLRVGTQCWMKRVDAEVRR